MSHSDIPPSGATPGPKGSSLPDRKLVSWKEIASYLGREVRTVQRWERTEDLLVHRHEHQKKSTVYAYTSELDEWFKNRQPADDPEADAAFIPEPDTADVNSCAEISDPAALNPVPAPVDVPVASPIVDSPKTVPPSSGKRVVVAIFALAIVSALSLGLCRWFRPSIAVGVKIRLELLPLANS